MINRRLWLASCLHLTQRHRGILLLTITAIVMFQSNVAMTILPNQTAFRCIHECPYSTVCNWATGFCECTNEYPILANPFRPCLRRKYLGELCIHTIQCSHIDNLICISDSYLRNELKELPRNEYFKNALMIKNPEKFMLRKDYGRCECRPGYWPDKHDLKCQGYDADFARLNIIECNGSHQCPDHNSHCNMHRRRCDCDYGHYYDPKHDRCLLNMYLFGVVCKTDAECQSQDENMRCKGICVCINHNRYDPIRGCNSCKGGQNWNELSKTCEPTTYRYLYTNYKTDWTYFTFKSVAFIVIFCAMIFGIKNKKSILPSISHLNLDGTRNLNGFTGIPPNRFDIEQTTNSGMQHNPQIATSSIACNNQLGPESHRINLRVNLNNDDNEEISHLTGNARKIVSCRRPSIASNSSLPPYESIDPNASISNVNQTTILPETFAGSSLIASTLLPDELPTYEEAVFFLTKTQYPTNQNESVQCNPHGRSAHIAEETNSPQSTKLEEVE